MLNPRYELYKKTTDSPTNWGYLSFINKMHSSYTGESCVLGKPILDQEGFTNHIKDICDSAFNSKNVPSHVVLIVNRFEYEAYKVAGHNMENFRISESL